jgi:hypothetical protein
MKMIFIAAFLSPRLAELQMSDPTLHDIVIETPDPNHYFENFLNLGFGSCLRVTTENWLFIRSICNELWNREVFDCIINNT